MSTVEITEVRAVAMEDYLSLIERDVIRVKGHRIGLEHIVERYREGDSPEQIAIDFPGVSLAQIYGIIAYYLQNEEEVNAYVARVNARAETAYQQWAANPSPMTERVRAIRAQRERK